KAQKRPKKALDWWLVRKERPRFLGLNCCAVNQFGIGDKVRNEVAICLGNPCRILTRRRSKNSKRRYPLRRFERLQLTTLQVNDTAVAGLARSRSDAGRFHDVLLDAAVYPCTPIDHHPVRGVAELPETLDTGNLAMTFPE